MKCLHHSAIVKFDDAAGGGRIGAKCHHGHQTMLWTIAVCSDEVRKISITEIIGMNDKTIFTSEEIKVSHNRSRGSEERLFVHQLDLTGEGPRCDEVAHLRRKIMSIDQELFDFCRCEPFQPNLQKRTASYGHHALWGVISVRA